MLGSRQRAMLLPYSAAEDSPHQRKKRRQWNRFGSMHSDRTLFAWSLWLRPLVLLLVNSKPGRSPHNFYWVTNFALRVLVNLGAFVFNAFSFKRRAHPLYDKIYCPLIFRILVYIISLYRNITIVLAIHTIEWNRMPNLK